MGVFISIILRLIFVLKELFTSYFLRNLTLTIQRLLVSLADIALLTSEKHFLC